MQDRIRQAQQRAREHETQVERDKKAMIIRAYKAGLITETGKGSYSVPSEIFVAGAVLLVGEAIEEYKAQQEAERCLGH